MINHYVKGWDLTGMVSTMCGEIMFKKFRSGKVL